AGGAAGASGGDGRLRMASVVVPARPRATTGAATIAKRFTAMPRSTGRARAGGGVGIGSPAAKRGEGSSTGAPKDGQIPVAGAPGLMARPLRIADSVTPRRARRV